MNRQREGNEQTEKGMNRQSREKGMNRQREGNE